MTPSVWPDDQVRDLPPYPTRLPPARAECRQVDRILLWGLAQVLLWAVVWGLVGYFGFRFLISVRW